MDYRQRGGYRDYQGYGQRNYRNNYRRNDYYNDQPPPQVKPKPRVEIDENDPNWKEKLSVPKKDTRQQTDDVTNTKGSDFETFSLSRRLLMGIFELGFEKPSPVQEEAIPLVLMGKSLLARAKNGTGKTGAFAIPTLQKVDENDQNIQVLVLLPTRELALQTAKVYKDLSKHLNLEIVTSTGGTELKDDIIRLRRAVQIVIGTPGRLQDLANQGILKIQQCKMIVLDEADKLLSPDFLPAVETLLDFMPEERQLLLFSATFPSAIKS